MAYRDFLCYGDVIALKYDEDTDGFLCTEGLANSGCYLSSISRGSDGDVALNFRDCVFEVMPRLQYEYAEHKDSLKSKPKALMTPAEADRHKRMKVATQRELDQNDAEQARMQGKSVTYGSIIQLIHVRSRRFLMVADRSSETEKDSLLVSVDHGSEAAWFRITPRFKVRVEGEKVCIDDLVVLQAVKRKCNLHVGKPLQQGLVVSSKAEREVNASPITGGARVVAWRVSSYFAFTNDSAQFLKSGDVFRLVHAEEEGNMCYQVVKDDPHVFLKLADDAKTSIDSHSLWEVELATAMKGGLVAWSKSVRFRHLTSGRYLCVERLESLADGPVGHTLATTSDQSKATTLFRLEAAGVQETELVPRKGKVRIVHTDNDGIKLWLTTTDVDISSGLTDMERLRELDTQRPLVKFPRVGLRPMPSDSDAFHIVHCPVELIDQVNYVLSVKPRLEAFTNKLLELPPYKDSKPPPPGSVSFDLAIGVVSELIFYATKSPMAKDAMTHKALPDRSRQKVLRELKLPDLLFGVISALTVEDGGRYIRLANLLADKKAHLLMRLIYRLLYHYSRDYSKNEFSLARPDRFRVFQVHSGFKVGSAGLLASLFSKNFRVLERLVGDEEIRRFMDVAKTGRSVRLDLLTALASCNGKPVLKNQNAICKRLFTDEYISVLYHSELTPEGRIVWVDHEPSGGEKRYTTAQLASKYAFQQRFEMCSGVSF
eukprot:TRINITY_DN850_c0_g2_i3.p1 TRINITY_DN850_c0_g2~~TRINITY_DN850_c0_g2_i3.p1  ORF type:complete len:714 (+),score=284.55 TRINITY_DN850_c0_g2_i3:279-2420(+)